MEGAGISIIASRFNRLSTQRGGGAGPEKWSLYLWPTALSQHLLDGLLAYCVYIVLKIIVALLMGCHVQRLLSG